jgi:hypothetical protein
MKSLESTLSTPVIVLLAPAALLALVLACAIGDLGMQPTAPTPTSPARDNATDAAIRTDHLAGGADVDCTGRLSYFRGASQRRQ